MSSVVLNSLRHRFFSGAFWSVAGALVARCASLAIAIVIARMISVENFGKLSILLSTTTMFATIAGLGLGLSCTRYVSELRHSDLPRVRRIVHLSLVTAILSGGSMAALSLGAAPFIATTMLAVPELVADLRVISLLLISDTLLGVLTGTLAGFEEFRTITRIGVMQAIISLPITVAGVWLYGITGAVSAAVFASMAGMLLAARATHAMLGKRQSIPGEQGLWSERSVLWRMALPITLSGMVVTPVIWLGNTQLSRSGGGYVQMGIFNAANQWRMLVSFLPGLLGSVLLTLTSSKEHGDSQHLKTANMIASWLLVSFPALLLMFFPEISVLVFGSKYDSADYRRAFILLLLGACTVAYKEGIARRLITDDLMWWGVLSNVVWGGMFTALLWLQPVTTAIDLATTYLVCYSVSTILFVPFYLKKGLVSRYMVTSKESMAIWTILIVASCLTVRDVDVLVRVPLYILFTGLLACSFFLLWRKASKL